MATRWVVTFEGRTGDDGRGTEEIRGLLKVALRRFGLRCVSVSGGMEPGLKQRGSVEERAEEKVANK